MSPKKHEYKFVVDGIEEIDPENPVFISNNIGGWNSFLDLRDENISEPLRGTGIDQFPETSPGPHRRKIKYQFGVLIIPHSAPNPNHESPTLQTPLGSCYDHEDLTGNRRNRKNRNGISRSLRIRWGSSGDIE